jgi:exodeoxyribonuclease VII small subunit
VTDQAPDPDGTEDDVAGDDVAGDRGRTDDGAESPLRSDVDGATAPGDDVESLSYEEARDALVTVVQTLEAGGVPLQESVELWERGERLADVCQRWLDGARARLEAAIPEDDR